MNEELRKIREKLGHLTLTWSPTLWLQTGIPELNRVIGHSDFGIPYGRIIEFSGQESNGKTAITLALAALAQRNRAGIIWGDAEFSFDPDWAILRGIAPCPECKGAGRDKNHKGCKVCGGGDPCQPCNATGKVANKICKDCKGSGEQAGDCIDTAKLLLIHPYVGTFLKKNKQGKMVPDKNARLTTAQDLMSEVEAAMTLYHQRFDRMVVVVDSLASLLPEGEAAAGLEHQNMRTNMDLPMFLGKLLRRWVGLAQSYNALIICTNQLRQDPTARFGGGWYTPGGNSPKFYSHIRIRANRVKARKIIDKGVQIGIQGVLKALKNKTGGQEGAECGFRLFYKGKVEFCPVKDVQEKNTEED